MSTISCELARRCVADRRGEFIYFATLLPAFPESLALTSRTILGNSIPDLPHALEEKGPVGEMKG